MEARLEALEHVPYLGPPRVTVLPTDGLIDGQEVAYIADAAKGIEWTFRYREVSGKWDFVDGPPLVEEKTDGSPSQQATTYGGTGASITIPFTGDYLVTIEGYAVISSPQGSDRTIYLSYSIGGTGASDSDAALVRTFDTATTRAGFAQRTRLKTGLAASTVLVSKMRQSAWLTPEQVTWTYQLLRVLPVKIG